MQSKLILVLAALIALSNVEAQVTAVASPSSKIGSVTSKHHAPSGSAVSRVAAMLAVSSSAASSGASAASSGASSSVSGASSAVTSAASSASEVSSSAASAQSSAASALSSVSSTASAAASAATSNAQSGANNLAVRSDNTLLIQCSALAALFVASFIAILA